jgi:hypothetical protein
MAPSTVNGSGVVSGAAGFEVLRFNHDAIGAQTEYLIARRRCDR